MVLPINNFFSRTQEITKRRPILNSIPFVTSSTQSRFGTFNSTYQQFWNWYRQSPELVAVTNTLATDIIGDRPTFTKPDGTQLGRNKLIEAKSFWRNQRCKETLKAIIFDMTVTGDGFGWLGRFEKDTRSEIAKELSNRISNEIKCSFKEKLLLLKNLDEDLKKPKSFDYVASSTVQINSDNFDVISYVQNSNGLTIKFSPDEIIHFRWQMIDGKIEGFSPVESLFKEIWLLWATKSNMKAFFENGGSPGKLFSMEDTQPGTDAYERFKEQLIASKDVVNRHKNWLGTGKITVNDLDANIKDMEYKDLSLYVTSIVAFGFNMPVTRIPFLIGSASSKGDSGGMAEQGYWNMISEKQDMIEDLMNSQLFEKLGWHIKFNRKYKQDTIRESQAANMNQDTVTKIMNIYRSVGKKIKINKLNSLVSGEGITINEEDLEDLSDEDKFNTVQKTGMMNQNMLDNLSIEKEPDNLKRADTKRNVANDNMNKGLNV